MLNELCDDDLLWGPLVGLRPPPEQRLTWLRLVAISAAAGLLYGMTGDLFLALLPRSAKFAVPPVYALPAIIAVLSFACLTSTFARAWNRRAELLSRSRAWHVAIEKPRCS